jgi:sulfur carrier protein ThiS
MNADEMTVKDLFAELTDRMIAERKSAVTLALSFGENVFTYEITLVAVNGEPVPEEVE